jgi:hypothetical protein
LVAINMSNVGSPKAWGFLHLCLYTYIHTFIYIYYIYYKIIT